MNISDPTETFRQEARELLDLLEADGFGPEDAARAAFCFVHWSLSFIAGVEHRQQSFREAGEIPLRGRGLVPVSVAPGAVDRAEHGVGVVGVQESAGAVIDPLPGDRHVVRIHHPVDEAHRLPRGHQPRLGEHDPPVQLQRRVRGVGAGAVGRAALADVVDDLIERSRRDAGLGQNVGAFGRLFHRKRQQQPFDGHVGVAGFLGDVFCGGEHLGERLGEIELAVAALDLGQRVERRFDAKLDRLGVAAGALTVIVFYIFGLFLIWTAGRLITDDEGRYRLTTIRPGAYPWGNHRNAWRPAHIHFSLFGPSYLTRLVTQMYFPGDPLLDLDPIFLGTPPKARERLISKFSIDVTEPDFALGYVFDIVLRGTAATPMEG